MQMEKISTKSYLPPVFNNVYKHIDILHNKSFMETVL